MELAEKIYGCIAEKLGAYSLLNLLHEIQDKSTLATINEFFMEHYHKSLNEYINEIFGVEELYAISSTITYIREPNRHNHKMMDKFYKGIGYPGIYAKKGAV
ncbi:MAG: hypothetical protein HC819_16435 [Cyclobacteriaceae bacterium]|nr:hypothetical protein [Cyclobacteriaceae bacterium]